MSVINFLYVAGVTAFNLIASDFTVYRSHPLVHVSCDTVQTFLLVNSFSRLYVYVQCRNQGLVKFTVMPTRFYVRPATLELARDSLSIKSVICMLRDNVAGSC